MSQRIEDIKALDFAVSGFVKVFVGPERTEFLIYKALLCKASLFFEKCINNDVFQEGQTGEVNLPEDDVDAFGVIMEWMFRCKLPLPDTLEKEATYIRAYLSADRFMMPQCKNAVLDAIRCKHVKIRIVGYIATGLGVVDLPASSLLRQYYIHQYAWHLKHYAGANSEDVKKRFEGWERKLIVGGGDFVADVVEKIVLNLFEKKTAKNPCQMEPCPYHERLSDEVCDQDML